ncbi:MAG: anthranilate synthase component I [Armatimonadetes bacterium]|nr:anthranilate synthase component I [Armatimonadota bacterium]
MYTPDFETFLQRAQHGNLIPVYREILADLETPVSAYLKLEQISDGYSFLLESVAGGENVARYSYLACSPSRLFSSKGREVTIRRGSDTQTIVLPEDEDPLDELKRQLAAYRFVPLPDWERFSGGAVGYLSYDMVRFFEDLPDENPDDLGLPESQFMFADTLVVFDHVRHRVRIMAMAAVGEDPQAAYWEAVGRIDRMVDVLTGPMPQSPARPPSPATIPDDPAGLPSTMTRAQHREAVLKAKEYIAAGDAIQIVLAHRLQAQIKVAPFDLYRALRAINPSPYMYYLSFGDLKIIGASPEILVTEDAGRVVTRPIAGTRRRGKTREEDLALEQELLADEKERAEHIMLVDLHRNDIGRVCEPGTVQVDALMTVERYSHVMHIVSNVVGKLAADKDQFDVLRATFPAGTVSGAPKIRAMEIIEELEPVRRGPYAGAVGYFSFSGSMDTCITLRTLVVKGNTVYFQAGGGIVADSDPDAEYQETLHKMGALLDAVRMAERGLV